MENIYIFGGGLKDKGTFIGFDNPLNPANYSTV